MNDEEKCELTTEIQDSGCEEMEVKNGKTKKIRKQAEAIIDHESQPDLSEEKATKKKTKKSKKEKVADKEKCDLKPDIQDSGCEEMEVKNKKTKKSKKDKNKHAEEKEAKDVLVEAEDAVTEKVSSKRALEEEVDTAEEVEGLKKKKKSKKIKPEVEDEAMPAAEEGYLKKDFPEAPGGFKGSNLMAIPGYGVTEK